MRVSFADNWWERSEWLEAYISIFANTLVWMMWQIYGWCITRTATESMLWSLQYFLLCVISSNWPEYVEITRSQQDILYNITNPVRHRQTLYYFQNTTSEKFENETWAYLSTIPRHLLLWSASQRIPSVVGITTHSISSDIAVHTHSTSIEPNTQDMYVCALFAPISAFGQCHWMLPIRNAFGGLRRIRSNPKHIGNTHKSVCPYNVRTKWQKSASRCSQIVRASLSLFHSI